MAGPLSSKSLCVLLVQSLVEGVKNARHKLKQKERTVINDNEEEDETLIWVIGRRRRRRRRRGQ